MRTMKMIDSDDDDENTDSNSNSDADRLSRTWYTQHQSVELNIIIGQHLMSVRLDSHDVLMLTILSLLFLVKLW